MMFNLKKKNNALNKKNKKFQYIIIEYNKI